MKKTAYDVILYLVAFAAIQIIVSFGTLLGKPFGLQPDDPIILVAISATASIITLLLFLWRKWTPVGKTYIQRYSHHHRGAYPPLRRQSIWLHAQNSLPQKNTRRAEI